MPGVPSGKGCDACRRQKKKCDQAKPACSRCARLKVSCVGGGQQRYKFMGQDPAATTTATNSGDPSSHCSSSSSPPLSSSSGTTTLARSARSRWSRPGAIYASERIVFLSEPLCNDTSRVTNQLVHVLKVSDARYDIRCYGGFIQLVPSRLGKNEALDAASAALSAAYPYLKHETDSAQALVTYGKALGALRRHLMKADEYVSVETLCAIYMIMLCQVWLGREEDSPVSHGQGLAHILAAIGRKGISNLDPFGLSLFNTLCFLVSAEGVLDSRVNLPQEVWDHLEGQRDFYDSFVSSDPNLHYWSLHPYNFQVMLLYMRQPDAYERELRPSYERLLGEIDRAFGNVVSFREGVTSQGELIFYLAQASLLIASAFMFNGFLKALEIDNPVLEADHDKMFEKMEALARDSLELRPLGSTHMLASIITAKASTDDEEKTRRSAELYQFFTQGFASSSVLFQSDFLKPRLRKLREMAERRRAAMRLLDDKAWIGLSEISGDTLEDVKISSAENPCTIM